MTKEISIIKILLAFSSIYFIWGSTYLAILYAIESIPPFFMMGIRSVSAGLVLYVWSTIRDREKVKREQIPSLITIGTSFFLICHGLLAWAEQRIPSGLAALLIASLPLWMATIELFVRSDFKLGNRGKTGLLFGFAGIALLILPRGFFGIEQLDILGLSAILLGSLAWAGASVYSRSAALPSSPLLTAGMELLFGGILLLTVAIVTGEHETFRIEAISARSIFSLGYLVIFGSVIAFTSFIWLLRVTTATRVSTYAFVNPVVAVFLGWLFAGESMGVLTVVSTVIIVISIYLILVDRSKSQVVSTSS
ncbi:MAG: EamA family transporter [Ignavibacteriae bacterium]|nr:EamA family transporter [Ignavibacteriota bacterium]